MAVQVFFCSIEPLRDTKRYEHYCALVPKPQQERLSGLKNEEDRLRSLAAGLMLHCAMNALAVPLPLRRVERLAGGRPILPEIPFQISLSHSGHVALCAIAEEAVGADVQLPKTPKQTLLERVCSRAELDWLASQENLAQAFAILWTRKESLLKALGRTIAEDLRQLSCLGDADSPWRFSERTLFGLPACACCGKTDAVTWNEIDLAAEEIQNSFDSRSQF